MGGMAIGELSRRTGCNIETIRYYEHIGLLPVPARSGRFRRYDEEDSRRLAFVRRARELGFSLEEVRALLRLAAREGDSCGEARKVAAAHLAEVRGKIADLRAMETALASAVRRCDADEIPGCPVIEALWSAKPRPSGRGVNASLGETRLEEDLYQRNSG
jgi:MerR family mercuric resistance operon transcriptional regulator